MLFSHRFAGRLVGTAILLTAASPLLAGECDIIDGFLNAEGALTLSNYSIADAAGVATTLSGTEYRGECQVSGVVMSTLPASSILEFGDGQTRQRIRVASMGVVNASYESHFSIAAPEMPGTTSPRELVFQETTFSSAEPVQRPAKLIFSLSAASDPSGANSSWSLTSRFADGSSNGAEDSTVSLLRSTRALVDGAPAAASQGFEIFLEFVPGPSPAQVRLRLTQKPFQGNWETTFFDFPAGTFPRTRSQGLIGQSNIPPDSVFVISNMGGRRPSGIGE